MREELERLLGVEAVSERPVHDLWPLGVIRARGGAERPRSLVVRPASYEEVGAVLRWAGEHDVGVVPLGGGSGVTGALDPSGAELVLDLGALDRILEVDEHDLWCRAQAGVKGMALEEELNRRGLKLGHYPSSLPVATVGGLVATRSSGQESMLYGNVEDILLGLVVALPSGSVVQARPPVRTAAGPPLHQLFAGSEGGLGVVLEASLRVHRVQPERGFGFGFDSLASGLEAMRAIAQDGLRPMVMRLYDEDDTQFQAAGLDSGCLLVMGLTGPEPTLDGQEAVVRAACDGAQALGEEPWRHWKGHRYDLSAERLLEFLKPAGSFVDTIEVAAPWSRLLDLHGAIKKALQEPGALALCHFSHASMQGACAYFTFAGAAEGDEAAERAYLAAWKGAMEAALQHGATISHHHGVGQVRAPWIDRELAGWREVWEAVRSGLDPAGIMNPRALGGRRR